MTKNAMDAGEAVLGPWVQDEDNPLCVGSPKPWYQRQVYGIVTVLEGGPEYTDEHNAKALANARLIAAAPDLLAALQKWLRHAEGNRSAYFRPVKGGGEAWVPLVQVTRAAIAKATRGDQ